MSKQPNPKKILKNLESQLTVSDKNLDRTVAEDLNVPDQPLSGLDLDYDPEPARKKEALKEELRIIAELDSEDS